MNYPNCMTVAQGDAQRDDLKRAVPSHPNWPAYRDSQMKAIGEMKKSELLEAFRVLFGEDARVPLIVDAKPVQDVQDPQPAPDVGQDADQDILASLRPVLHGVLLRDAEEGIAALRSETDMLKQALSEECRLRKRLQQEQHAAPSVDGWRPPVVTQVGSQHWLKALGVRSSNGKSIRAELPVCDYAMAPEVDHGYVWPTVTGRAAAAIARGRNVFLYGPAGSGKTTFAAQIAARTSRPFTALSFNAEKSAHDLLGFSAPAKDGGMVWEHGELTRAMQVPYAVILLDEIGLARSGLVGPLLSILQDRQVTLADGSCVRVAEGVSFIAANNDNGTLDSHSAQYVDLRPVNRAMLDRFSVHVAMDYLSKAQEVKALMDRSGCKSEIATVLVEFAALTRKAVEAQDCEHAIGLRRLVAYAEALCCGVASKAAFGDCVIGAATHDDRLCYEQLASAHLDHGALDALASPLTQDVVMPVSVECQDVNAEASTRAGFDAINEVNSNA